MRANQKQFAYVIRIMWRAQACHNVRRCAKCAFTFYRAMHFSAKRGIAIACRLSVCLSVCPSVTLVDCDHIGWNSSKIISSLVSLGCSLFATPNMTGLLQGEHPEIFARIGVGCWKSGFRRTKALISLKRGKRGPRLLLRSNRKSYTRFRLVPKSMTLDDLEGSLCTLFQNTCVFRSSL